MELRMLIPNKGTNPTIVQQTANHPSAPNVIDFHRDESDERGIGLECEGDAEILFATVRNGLVSAFPDQHGTITYGSCKRLQLR